MKDEMTFAEAMKTAERELCVFRSMWGMQITVEELSASINKLGFIEKWEALIPEKYRDGFTFEDYNRAVLEEIEIHLRVILDGVKKAKENN